MYLPVGTEVVRARRAGTVKKADCRLPEVAGTKVWRTTSAGVKYLHQLPIDECGIPAKGAKYTQRNHITGEVKTFVEKDGKFVEFVPFGPKVTRMTREFKACKDAGVPMDIRAACAAGLRAGKSLEQVMAELQGGAAPGTIDQCIAAGVPPEMVEECAALLSQGVPLDQIVAAIPGAGKKFPWLLVAGGGAALLVGFFLWKRRKK
jgi:LPXTG-motif cell wall-anchored protein